MFDYWCVCLLVLMLSFYAGMEFKANKGLTDPKEIEFHIKLADTNLDSVLLQAEHLTTLMNDPNYQVDI